MTTNRTSNAPDADPPPEDLIDVAVLDDDLDFLGYMEDFLRDEGHYSVRTFTQPDVLFAQAGQRRPDIVLLDMKMGDVSGGGVLEQLLARFPGLCVIILTGYPSLEDMRATFRLKVFDYVPKPFTLAQIRQVLANAIATFSLGRALPDRLREKLGHRIRLLRAEREWSLKDLAQASRLSISQISSIERGANLPSIESLLAIARAFDKKPSEILAAIDF
jgi:DNA-binding NtrC family response regulator